MSAQFIPETTADLSESANKNYVTDAEKVVIGNTSGVNTGDQSLTGLLDETAHDALDHTGLPGVGAGGNIITTADGTYPPDTPIGTWVGDYSGNIYNPPTVASIPPQAFLYGSGVTIPVTIGDQYDVGACVLATVVANTTVLTAGDVARGGTLGNRNITIAPLLGATATTMTARVTNINGDSAEVTFDVIAASQLFTITTSAGANGTIDATQTVAQGGSVTITATPNATYSTATWVIDGGAPIVATGNDWTLTNVQASHTIAATFALALPTQPVITATNDSATTATITLISGGIYATSFNIKWGTSAGARTNTITGVTLPYNHTGRTSGATYYYSVVAVNGVGSTESAEQSTAIPATYPLNLTDGAVLANGFTAKFSGTNSSITQTAENTFHMNDFTTGIAMASAYPTLNYLIKSEPAEPYTLDFTMVPAGSVSWTDAPESNPGVVVIWDTSVDMTGVPYPDLTKRKLVVSAGSAGATDLRHLQIWYRDTGNIIRYWSGSVWGTDSVFANDTTTPGYKITVLRNANNSYTITVKTANGVTTLATCTTGTDVRSGTVGDKVVIGDGYVGNSTGTNFLTQINMTTSAVSLV